jgi:hypothetical protein
LREDFGQEAAFGDLSHLARRFRTQTATLQIGSILACSVLVARV